MQLLRLFLSLGGGLALFLFGMNVLGESLRRRAGNRLEALLGKLTKGRLRGFLLGFGVTVAVQSSSAVTVMTVGFVNSGIMTLRQAVGVIIGANVGTTVTAWILSTSALESTALWLEFLKPSFFTPILALLGIGLLLFSKKESRQNTGNILLGFAVLMFGMEAMSAAVKPISEIEGIEKVFLFFSNPLIGILTGAILTAVLQSSSASVGILQALSVTGQLSFGAAIPIIMGQNVGTCVTGLISSIGTTYHAKRVAVVHLYFNLFGTALLLTAFLLAKRFFVLPFLSESVRVVDIAVIHTLFNLACTIVFLPLAGLLERLAIRTVKAPTEESHDA